MAITLPSEEVRMFLLELIQKANYPGTMVEFVAGVKKELAYAEVKSECATTPNSPPAS